MKHLLLMRAHEAGTTAFQILIIVSIAMAMLIKWRRIRYFRCPLGVSAQASIAAVHVFVAMGMAAALVELVAQIPYIKGMLEVGAFQGSLLVAFTLGIYALILPVVYLVLRQSLPAFREWEKEYNSK